MMEAVDVQRHAHNWVITTEYFNSCKSLTEFFHVLGVDDGLPQDTKGFEGSKEFPLIIEAKAHPIHAWLTHPENALMMFYGDVSDSTHKDKTYNLHGKLYEERDLPTDQIEQRR